MNSTPKNQANSTIELEEREVPYLKGHLQDALKSFELRTYAISRFLNSLEIFQIQPNQFIRDTVAQGFNSQIKDWKTKCIPKIRANAKKFPDLELKNITSINDFFKWLKSMGLVDGTDTLVTRIDEEIYKILQKDSTN